MKFLVTLIPTSSLLVLSTLACAALAQARGSSCGSEPIDFGPTEVAESAHDVMISRSVFTRFRPQDACRLEVKMDHAFVNPDLNPFGPTHGFFIGAFDGQTAYPSNLFSPGNRMNAVYWPKSGADEGITFTFSKSVTVQSFQFTDILADRPLRAEGFKVDARTGEEKRVWTYSSPGNVYIFSSACTLEMRQEVDKLKIYGTNALITNLALSWVVH